jgi:hypothetical protein
MLGPSPPPGPPAPGPFPPAPGPFPPAHPSTVSSGAGQVQRRSPPPSRTGLWIGLGLVAVAGVGIAAAVIAGGSSGGEVPTPTALSADSSGSAAAGRARPGSTDADGEAADDAAASGEAAGGEAAGGEAIAEQQALESMLKNLDGIDTSMLPPAARKQLKDLKQLGKLSPKERQAKLQQIMESMQKDMGGGLAEAMDTIDAIGSTAPRPGKPSSSPSSSTSPSSTPSSSTSPSGTPSSTPSSPPGAWVTRRDLSFAGFNPKRIDVSAFIRWAIAEAKKADPGAVLFRVDVSGVSPDGFANLELPTLASDHGSLDLRFFSPARAKPDPSLPVGVPDRSGKACEFRIEAEPDGVAIRPISGFDCKRNVEVPPPRCTAAALWKQALSAKAPQNAVASLGYRAASKRPRWYFDIGYGRDKVFSRAFDDC